MKFQKLTFSLIFTLVIIMLNQVNCDHPCNDWILHETGGTTAKCYKIINQYMNYEAAEKYCNDKQSVLLMIKSEEEYEFITNLLRDEIRLSKTDIWLGAKRDNATDAVLWNDLSSIGFSKWSEGQPDKNDVNEICVEMFLRERRMSIHEYAKWNDVSCEDINAAVCEKSIPFEEFKCG